ncbi:MAG: hypothetical protein P8075_13720 [Deltaproteobacteria bacterium]|jgi:hypothetical protein
MNRRNLDGWKTVAWNGISMQVPSQWEVSSLAKSYLQMEDGVGPVLELKWQQVRGVFSHQDHLKKLARHSRSVAGLSFRQISLPEEWRQALRHFEAKCFEWQGGEINGKGVVLYCPASQQASLLQFYQQRDLGDSEVHLTVLDSFRDPCEWEHAMVRWSLFGLKALIPKSLELVRYRFQPGHYQLEFKDGRGWVDLKRWGPADLLLRESDLLHWFEKSCKELDWCRFTGIREDNHQGRPALYGKSRGSESPAARLWARVSRKFPNVWIRIWHLSSRNQILGVVARSFEPLDEHLLEKICRSYDMA